VAKLALFTFCVDAGAFRIVAIFEKIRSNVNRPPIGSHLGMAERLHQRPGDDLVRIYANHREPDSR
jgi:hypothetical protein